MYTTTTGFLKEITAALSTLPTVGQGDLQHQEWVKLHQGAVPLALQKNPSSAGKPGHLSSGTSVSVQYPRALQNPKLCVSVRLVRENNFFVLMACKQDLHFSIASEPVPPLVLHDLPLRGVFHVIRFSPLHLLHFCFSSFNSTH